MFIKIIHDTEKVKPAGLHKWSIAHIQHINQNVLHVCNRILALTLKKILMFATIVWAKGLTAK